MSFQKLEAPLCGGTAQQAAGAAKVFVTDAGKATRFIGCCYCSVLR